MGPVQQSRGGQSNSSRERGYLITNSQHQPGSRLAINLHAVTTAWCTSSVLHLSTLQFRFCSIVIAREAMRCGDSMEAVALWKLSRGQIGMWRVAQLATGRKKPRRDLIHARSCHVRQLRSRSKGKHD